MRIGVRRLAWGLALLLVATASPAVELVNTLGPASGLFASPKPTGVAIRGYDPVAYFLDGKPEAGLDAYQWRWRGAIWKFATRDHLDRFKADPEKYAPQYGGYCAYGAAHGNLVEIEPDQWTVLDGKLYLNYDAGINRSWRADPQTFIREADHRYPQLIAP